MKKSRPIIVLGAVIAGLTFIIDSLQGLFKDNPQMVLILSVIGITVTGVSVFKDRYVEGQTVPVKDAVVYINERGEPVAGPASPLPTGSPVDATTTGVVSEGAGPAGGGDSAVE